MSNTTPPPSLSNRFCPEGMNLEEWQVALRKQYALRSDFEVSHLDSNRIWGDYLVKSGKNHYRVAFRGVCSDQNFCSCLDFRTNGLGTCKHVEAVVQYLSKEYPATTWTNEPFNPTHTMLYVKYRGERTIECNIATGSEDLYAAWQKRYFKGSVLPPEHYYLLDEIIEEGKVLSPNFRCSEDVLELVRTSLLLQDWRKLVEQELPQGKLPPAPGTAEEPALDTVLYQTVWQGDAILPIVRPAMGIPVAIRIMSFCHEHLIGPMLCIACNAEELVLWRTALRQAGLSEIVQCMTAADLEADLNCIQGNYALVWVSCGDLLCRWTHPVSVALKRVSKQHLFIVVSRLSLFTPMQFSSVAQHIEPYILGPTYLFVERGKSFFPMSDLPEYLPKILEGLVQFLPLSLTTTGIEAMNTPTTSPRLSPPIVELLIQIRHLLQDPTLREELLTTLNQILPPHAP